MSLRSLVIMAMLAAPGMGIGAQATADFAQKPASPAARKIADWVVSSGDNTGAAFFIVDKARARLLVFNANGKLQGTSPVLLGLARGDDTVPGIADKPLAEVRPHERTTPAGRFVAERGRNLQGDDIVWIDYAAAVSLHRVRNVNPGDRRVERLMTATIADNRISYGCINVPVAFYDHVVEKALTSGRGVVVYVLPEQRTLEEIFVWPRSFVSAAALLRHLG